MLKLLKHDFKDTYFEVTILNAATICLAVWAFLSLKINIGSPTLSAFFVWTACSGWVLSLLASSFIILLSIIRSFHKRLFTDYGYLTLTTPVSVDKILLSKIIVNMVWMIATSAVAILSVFIISAGFGANLSFLGTILLYLIKEPLDLIMSVITLLASALQYISVLILVLVWINTSGKKKYKVIKGIFVYLIVSYICTAINPFGNSPLFASLVYGNYMHPILIYSLSLLFTMGIATALYFISRHIIINKLELE